MNLVKLKDTNGNEVWVNPAQVVFVASSKMVGRAVVQFTIPSLALETLGIAQEVRDLLSDTPSPKLVRMD